MIIFVIFSALLTLVLISVSCFFSAALFVFWGSFSFLFRSHLQGSNSFSSDLKLTSFHLCIVDFGPQCSIHLVWRYSMVDKDPTVFLLLISTWHWSKNIYFKNSTTVLNMEEIYQWVSVSHVFDSNVKWKKYLPSDMSSHQVQVSHILFDHLVAAKA